MDPYLVQLCRLAANGSSMVHGTFVLDDFERHWTDGGLDASQNARFFLWANTFRRVGSHELERLVWPDGQLVARSAAEWLNDQMERGCQKFELMLEADIRALLPDYMSELLHSERPSVRWAWLMQLQFESHAEVWANERMVNARSAYDERVTSVTYLGVPPKAPLQQTSAGLADAASVLYEALVQIRAFAADHRHGFVATFDDAAARLSMMRPEQDFIFGTINILPVQDYSLNARRLVAAASAASWVFGGTGAGSWFDAGPEAAGVKAQNEKTLSALVRAINGALLSAVNQA